MAAVVNFAVYDDIIRDIPRAGPWSMVGLIIALIVFGGAALFLNMIFVVMLVAGTSTALKSLKPGGRRGPS